MTRTHSEKPADAIASRKWWVLDAKGQSLGRLASRAAVLLRGKHKPTFTPHVDCGDFVVVINAGAVALTGQKATTKMYFRSSGRPGGLKQESFLQLSARDPGAPIELAVRGMLPKNSLGRQMIRKLKVYPTAEHPHVAQQPQPLSL